MPNLSLLTNAHYAAGVEYDYDRNSCGCRGEEGDRCDGYGRCSTIDNARVTKVDIVAFAKNVCENIEDEFTRYCVERVIVHSPARDRENWEVKVCGGYYGEEVDGVNLPWPYRGEVEGAIAGVVGALTNKTKLMLALNAEYGYVLPALEPLDHFEIMEVPTAAVRVPQTDHYKRLDRGIVKMYEGYQGIVGVGIMERERNTILGYPFSVRLIDGYHRFSGSQKRTTIKMIVGR